MRQILIYQRDLNTKVWRMKGYAYDSNCTSSSMQHGAEVCGALVWTCITASVTGSFIFTDDVTQDACSGMNSEIYNDILSSNSQRNPPKLFEMKFIM